MMYSVLRRMQSRHPHMTHWSVRPLEPEELRLARVAVVVTLHFVSRERCESFRADTAMVQLYLRNLWGPGPILTVADACSVEAEYGASMQKGDGTPDECAVEPEC
jgi:hypothetical protein